MLRLPFVRSAEPLTIHMDQLDQELALSKHLRDDPDFHIQLLQMIGNFTVRGSSLYGPAKTRFVKADRFITSKDNEDAKIPSSAVIATTEESRSFGRKAFRLMIARESKSTHDMSNALAFSLEGTYGKDGILHIHKMQAPGLDTANRLTPTKPITLNMDNLNLALIYARKCAEAIYSGEPLMMRSALTQARHAHRLAPKAETDDAFSAPPVSFENI